MAKFDRTILSTSSSLSNNSSPDELNTPSPTDILLEPSILSNNIPLTNIINQQQKCSIHHQDAEASISDTFDCLRMINGKMEWFYRKQQFCPNLITTDDIKQITTLHQRILIEEIPFLELQNKIHNGQVVDIPKELEGKIATVFKFFNELKIKIDNLITNVTLAKSIPSSPTPIITTTTTTTTATGTGTTSNNDNNKTIIEAVQ